MSGERFLPQYRIRRGADFDRAYKRRRSASDDRLLIFVCEKRTLLPAARPVGGQESGRRGAPQSLEAAAARSFFA